MASKPPGKIVDGVPFFIVKHRESFEPINRQPRGESVSNFITPPSISEEEASGGIKRKSTSPAWSELEVLEVGEFHCEGAWAPEELTELEGAWMQENSGRDGDTKIRTPQRPMRNPGWYGTRLLDTSLKNTSNTFYSPPLEWTLLPPDTRFNAVIGVKW